MFLFRDLTGNENTRQKMKRILLILGTLTAILCGLYGCGGGKTINKVDAKDSTIVEPQPSPFNVKLYIENSGSMDGYVNGSADFKNALHSYINDIQLRGIAQNISLNFINSRIINKGNDIKKFFTGLNSSTAFIQSGGDRKSTDIAQVVESVINDCGQDDVAIIVSDFIFSPGKGKNPERYLEEQQILLNTTFTKYLQQCPDAGVMFLQLTSNFSGTYYNRDNAKTKLTNVERPFYMLVIGSKNAVKSIRKNVPETKIKGATVRNFFIVENNFSTPEYSVIHGTGNFQRSKTNTKHAIADAAKDRNGNLTFNVNVNFSKSLLDENYLLNTDNYLVSNKMFALNAEKQGTNLVLKLSSQNVVKETLSIKLRKKIPQWISDFNDDTGLDINAATEKTYGLKTIVGGIAEAFNVDCDSYYTELLIEINQ